MIRVWGLDRMDLSGHWGIGQERATGRKLSGRMEVLGARGEEMQLYGYSKSDGLRRGFDRKEECGYMEDRVPEIRMFRRKKSVWA